ncbi:prolipoprotein diacylglyceryl transferase [Bacteriovorax sp. Seq25_V]|uniref:prolipoprotein diacylglyceryl transferase n=1 Tax=Bacteriovorax sp. Seq25_V TaxID=1201288 RepID=UPI00038A4188|nr:prolipoprotein diacylglyceryl transferase [Bacteriovorax sp. Seq25_V]EQC44793.1 prolipoprotein diacylglyceryl transferase [Bacteriovorax sp. Seq25_V]
MHAPDISPVLISLGPLQVRWYALMYVVGFILAGYLLKNLIKKNFLKITEEQIDSLTFIMGLCMVLGARFIYVFVYNWSYYQHNLGEVFAVWKGGLSFHGAVLGFLVAGFIFAKKNKVEWGQIMDSVCLVGAPGIFFGRLGNFINGELYGRITTSPVGMIFKTGGPYPRHPSQLYEAFFEGLVLSLILWFAVNKVKKYWQISSFFLIGYGAFRFGVEFFREADAQLGYYFGFMTMGQILCAIMIIAGFALYAMANKLNQKIYN